MRSRPDRPPTAGPNAASAAELMAALPHIRAAPRTDAPIQSLCFRPGPNRREFPASLRLTRAEGIPVDRWLNRPWLRLPDSRPDPRIQVSILPSRVLNLVWRDRDRVPHPGDTIVADLDTSTENFPEGSLLRAGTAVLQVSVACCRFRGQQVRVASPAARTPRG